MRKNGELSLMCCHFKVEVEEKKVIQKQPQMLKKDFQSQCVTRDKWVYPGPGLGQSNQFGGTGQQAEEGGQWQHSLAAASSRTCWGCPGLGMEKVTPAETHQPTRI